MKRFLLSAITLSITLPVFAQMSLNDCLLYAREHAFSNMVNRHSIDKARAEQRIALSGLMPSMSFSSSGSLSFGRNIDPETNTYDNKKTLSTSYGISMSIPLFDGLVNINNLNVAKVSRLRQEKLAQAEQDRISLDVIRSFYKVSYCKAMVSQMESQVMRDSLNLAACVRGEELGMRSGADVAELEAILASDRYELCNQKNILSKAFLQLRSDMGMELSEDSLYLVEEDEICRLPIPSGGFVWTDNPNIQEAELGVRESNLNLRNAKGNLLPSIYINGGISSSFYRMMGLENYYSPSFSRQFKDNLGEYVGFSFSLPIFDGLANVNRIKRAKAALLESKVRLDQTRYEIQKQTVEASADLRSSTEEFAAAEARLKAEQMAYKAISRKFELGSASAIDLYTAGAKLSSARAAHEGKRIQKIINTLILSYYLGNPLIKE